MTVPGTEFEMILTSRRGTLFLVGVLLISAAYVGPASSAEVTAADGYGPLTFNGPGTDFYFSQNGKFAAVAIGADRVIEVHLVSAPFQIGYNGRQANIALAQVPMSEISTDPKGFKASRLSGPMSGGREPNSDALLVYSGKLWSDGNTELSDETSMAAASMPGFQHSYQVSRLIFVDGLNVPIEAMKGTLHGYIVVYKQAERMNRDIMPIRLIFAGPASR